VLNSQLQSDVFSLLTEYGVLVDLLLVATREGTNRFQQQMVSYAEPLPVLGHKVFGKNEQMRLLAQVPDGVAFDATVTFSTQHLREATGRTSKDVLTITDRLSFDAQTWEIVATHYTGEVRGEFLVVVAFVRSLPSEYQRPALRP